MTEPTPQPDSTVKPPRKRRRRWILAPLLALLMLPGVAGLWCYHLLKTPPAYWLSNQQLLAQENARLVFLKDAAERRLLQAFSAEGGVELGEQRIVAMSFDEINAWLALQYEDWSGYFSFPVPSQIRQPMLATSGDRLVVAFELEARGMRQVISIINDVQLLTDGQAHLRLYSVRAGRLPVPFRTAFSLLGADGDGQDAHRALIALALDGHHVEPVINHPGDARLRIRLVGLTLTPHGIEAALAAERRP